MAGMANTAPRPCLFTHSQSHTHIHSLSLVLVAMMKSKELKTKIYSHAHSLILSSLFLSLSFLSPCFGSLRIFLHKIWASFLQPHTHTLAHSHTFTITCTCWYDEINRIQDQDLFPCSFSDSLSVLSVLSRLLFASWLSRRLDHASLHSHTLLITCTCCCDEIKGTQDKDFSYSFSDSLSRSVV